MKEITLLRHGDTEATEKGYFSGWSDVPLSRRGRERIALLRPLFSDRRFQGIFVSPLSRALETFRLLFPEGSSFEVHEDIRERSFGDWEGVAWEDIGKRFPEEIERWKAEPFLFTPPGGESFVQMQNRISCFWEEITSREDGRYLVVTHAGTIRCLLAHLTGMSFQTTFHLLLDPGVRLNLRHGPLFTQVVSLENSEVPTCPPF
ncbi:MAG TPA: histidine phosphatase family protein [Atribacteraceae bacterium]|nr:histidine phosphatase family protein [Atribacteraceae bacterium]